MNLSENLVKVNLLRKELDELRPLSKQAGDKLWQKLRLEWDYNSNHIEGNTLTYGETMLLLLHGDTTGDHDIREYDEMRAHDMAIHLVKEWASDKERDLTEADIRSLNKIILVKPYWKEALTYDGQPTRRLIKVGDYKEHPNSVRLKTGEMFHYASPEETPRQMEELLNWYRTTEIKHPVYLAAELHYRFICIHPFDDGNGRIARLLVNYVLMKHGYTPLIVKSADKENYLAALRKADAGDKAAFPNYIAEQQIWSLELEIKAAKGESLEEPDDIDKEITLLKREMQRESALKERGTYENIYKAIQESIIPLFKMLDKKADELKDLFFDYERAIQYTTLGIYDYTTIDITEKGWSVIDDWLREVESKYQQVQKFNYAFRLKGSKTTVDAIHIVMNIDVDFDTYNYKVMTNITNQPKTFAYGKPILLSDMNDLVGPIIKNAINRIKQGR